MNDAATVTERLRRLAAASDLSSGRRLATKVDLSSDGIVRRLRTQSRLRDACLEWARIGRSHRIS